MSNFFTLLIEATALFSVAYFSIAFVVGFIQYERELHPVATIPDVNIDMDELLEDYETYHKPIIEDTVIPFTRPYRKPVCEPIDWRLWGIRDLRRASQRVAFGVPVELAGKSLTKPQFVALYEAALLEEVAIAVDAA